jgi:hypothetical protein
METVYHHGTSLTYILGSWWSANVWHIFPCLALLSFFLFFIFFKERNCMHIIITYISLLIGEVPRITVYNKISNQKVFFIDM